MAKPSGVIARSRSISPLKSPLAGSGIFTAATFGSFARRAIRSSLKVNFVVLGLL
jgi:hypothetical protein